MSTNEWTTEHFRSVFFEEDTAGSVREVWNQWRDEVFCYDPITDELTTEHPRAGYIRGNIDNIYIDTANINVNVTFPEGACIWGQKPVYKIKKKLDLRLPDELFKL